MPPIPAQADRYSASTPLAQRSLDPSVVGLIVIFALLASIITVTLILVLRRVWISLIQPKLASRRSKALESQSPPPPMERRESHWARKNSNVLWSMYINDDDLAKQFARPPYRKDSRIFSVGSVSTLGPLDTISSGPGPAVVSVESVTSIDTATVAVPAEQQQQQHQLKGSNVDAVVRSRAVFEPENTPTKNLPSPPRRATYANAHAPNAHRCSHSF